MNKHFSKSQAGGGYGRSDHRAPRETITESWAPYNFAPLSPRVHFAADEARLSHDHPFADGLSGSIAYTLSAHTPLLVGGGMSKHGNGPGEIKPFRLPNNGSYAIPGSSLKGMIRSVLEIASHARFQFVDERHFGLRDVASANYSKEYGRRIATDGGAKAGWIRRASDGMGVEFRACAFARVSHRELSDLVHRQNVFERQVAASDEREAGADPLVKPMKVAEKFGFWRDAVGHPAKNGCFDITHQSFDASQQRVAGLGSGDQSGVLVVTGQAYSSGASERTKRHEYLFLDPPGDCSEWEPLAEVDFRAFLDVTAPRGEMAEKSGWAYWKPHFDKGHEVPVFWIGTTVKRLISLANMMKLPAEHSVHECARATSPQHAPASERDESDRAVDFVESLFGHINEAADAGALRGRLMFGQAVAERADLEPSKGQTTVMSSPRASFFPNYLMQPAKPDDRYHTYAHEGEPPHLRGWKRYPVAAQASKLPEPPEKSQASAQVTLHMLPANQKFTGCVRFHNLRPAELGALLWALTWRQDGRLRHSLGMAKNAQCGQVSFQIDPDRSSCRSVADDAALVLDDARVSEFIAALEDEMARGVVDWGKSASVRTLLAMADPQQGEKRRLEGKLRHPNLAQKEFQNIKNAGAVLPAWPPAPAFRPGAKVDPHAPAFEAFFHAQFSAQRNVKEDDFRRGRALAEKIQSEADPERRKAFARVVLADWDERGWMEGLGKSAKAAKGIYDGILAEE